VAEREPMIAHPAALQMDVVVNSPQKKIELPSAKKEGVASRRVVQFCENCTKEEKRTNALFAMEDRKRKREGKGCRRVRLRRDGSLIGAHYQFQGLLPSREEEARRGQVICTDGENRTERILLASFLLESASRAPPTLLVAAVFLDARLFICF